MIVVAGLLRFGADPSAVDSIGNTPLLSCDSIEMSAMLVAAGAPVDHFGVSIDPGTRHETKAFPCELILVRRNLQEIPTLDPCSPG